MLHARTQQPRQTEQEHTDSFEEKNSVLTSGVRKQETLMTERSNARGQCFKDTPGCRLLFWMSSNRHIDGFIVIIFIALAPSQRHTCSITPTSASKQTRNHHDTCAQPATLARSRSMGGEIHLD